MSGQQKAFSSVEPPSEKLSAVLPDEKAPAPPSRRTGDFTKGGSTAGESPAH